MSALLICALAFGVTFWAGKRSLGQGLIALLTVGYFYGILRANLLTIFAHFIFDAGLLGLYFSQKWTTFDPKEARRLATLRLWTLVLIVWPLLVVLMPFQPLLVSLVGLRGHIFFVPVLLLGGRLKSKDLSEFAYGLAVLNIVAGAFGIAEYFLGVMRFYPVSPVTQIIYFSGDVAGGYYRIPAIFANAHAYGGTMVDTLPFLIGLWDQSASRVGRTVTLVGIVTAMMGVLMSAARLTFILGSGMLIASLLGARMKSSHRVGLLVLLAVLGVSISGNERLLRFKSLSDGDYVVDRIAGSVNRGFWEILAEHPMGNGLGGGGTSIPYFLQGQVRNPIGMENSYALILCELGIVGLLLWVGFIVWFLIRCRVAFSKGIWGSCRKLAWCLGALSLGIAWIGIGLFTSIPGTVILLLSMGLGATEQRGYQVAGQEAPTRPKPYKLGYAALTS